MNTRLGLKRVGRAVVTGSGRFGPAPSGDLIHHPHEADGISSRLGPGDLATDLLHHGHKVRGVGLGSECLTPEVTAQDLDEAELVATTGPTNLEVRRHSPVPNPRRFARRPPAAQSLRGISTRAWGCPSAASATPGYIMRLARR
jgi:hypothetical protein